MTRLALASLATLTAISSVSLACSSKSSGAGAGPGSGDASVEAAGDDGPAATGFTLAIPCTDSIASIYGDPGTLPSDNGHVLKCAVDADLAKSDMQATAAQAISTDDP